MLDVNGLAKAAVASVMSGGLDADGHAGGGSVRPESTPPWRGDGGDLVLGGETDTCVQQIARGEHLLIGISPFNSRFTPTYVCHMLRLGVRSFDRVDVLLPDEDMAALLPVARGMTHQKAVRKVRKELGRHRRSLERVLKDEGLDGRVCVFQFSDFVSMPAYRDAWSVADDAMRMDAEFRAACITLTGQAIAGAPSGGDVWVEPCPEAVGHALPYVLAEMPFYVDSPRLFDVDSSVFAYHRSWPIARYLRKGQGGVRLHSGQGHGIFSYRTASAVPEMTDGDANVRAR